MLLLLPPPLLHELRQTQPTCHSTSFRGEVHDLLLAPPQPASPPLPIALLLLAGLAAAAAEELLLQAPAPTLDCSPSAWRSLCPPYSSSLDELPLQLRMQQQRRVERLPPPLLLLLLPLRGARTCLGVAGGRQALPPPLLPPRRCGQPLSV